MDLKNFDSVSASEQGAKIQLRNPMTGEPLEGAYISVCGMHSQAYKQAFNRIQTRRMEMIRKNRQLTPEMLEANSIELLAFSTKGWEGIKENGEDLPFSVENAKRVYRDYPWIREQIDAEISDLNNFLSR